MKADLPDLAAINAARDRLRGFTVRTPLVRHATPGRDAAVYLKLENLQPSGAYKSRPAASVLVDDLAQARARGVFTASSGNSGVGLAQIGSALGVPVSVIVPDDAPRAKLERLEALGAEIIELPYAQWWQVILTQRHERMNGIFFDAVGDPRAIAGNAVIAQEILEDLPEVDTIMVPFGGGGLLCGIAAAVRALKPGVRVIGCELDTARPLAAALGAGRPTEVAHESGFVSGIGAGCVLERMWPRLQHAADAAVAASQAATAAAIARILWTNKVLAEGAGAVSLAACLANPVAGSNIVCVVSGGNIDASTLGTILAGGVPGR